MFEMFVRLVLVVSLARLGMTLTEVMRSPDSFSKQLITARAHTLRIEWRPISVFPDKALGDSAHAR